MEGSLHQTKLPAEEDPPRSILKQEESSKDPFKSLPDELIVSHILGRISEAKSVCLISSVSRRFSSLVYQTHAVSVKIALSWSRPAGQFLDLETSANFLVKFSSIKSLYVELDYSSIPARYNMDPLVAKWKIDSGSASFMILTAARFQLATTDDGNEGGDSATPDLNWLHFWRSFNGYMKTVHRRFEFVGSLVRLLPESLQKVVVADSEREGRFHVEGSDIIRMRNGSRYFGDGEANLRVWRAPFLKLPSAGSVMKAVTLFISKGTNGSVYDDLLIAREAFDGEDDHQVYMEATVEMMKRDLFLQTVLQKQDFSFRLCMT